MLADDFADVQSEQKEYRQDKHSSLRVLPYSGEQVSAA
jgi:hypothetical protein